VGMVFVRNRIVVVSGPLTRNVQVKYLKRPSRKYWRPKTMSPRKKSKRC
jgi:hypothetical protein